MFILVWSIGVFAPLCQPYCFKIYTVPIRNIIIVLITLSSLNQQTLINQIVPLPPSIGLRLIIENEKVHKYFRDFLVKLKIEKWLFFLDVIMRINIYKLKTSPVDASKIASSLIANQTYFSSQLIKEITATMQKAVKTENPKSDIFDDFEIYIFEQYDAHLFNEFKKSSYFKQLTKEADEILDNI